MTPEGKVKKKIKNILEELGMYYFMPPANGYGRAGIPDFIICSKGRLIAIESKAKNNKPTALQARELQRISDAGGVALVVNEDNLDSLKMELQKLL